MAAIPFPLSSLPGQRPGKGQGRLINCLAEKNGDQVLWRRAPGLIRFADTGEAIPRGMIDVGGTLYAAFDDVAVTVSSAGVTTVLTGSFPGDGPVTWARNNRSPSPDVVVVSDAGAFVATSTTITAYPDADLPQPNSVAPLDNYFIFSIGDGTIYASGLGTTDVDPLSFAKAESDPDGLIRGVAKGSEYIAFGPSSFEVWTDAGTSPFPLARVAAVPVGLLAPFAVAGHESGWDQPLFFVAADNTVRRKDGYEAVRVSIPDVEGAIQSVSDKGTLRASVHVVAGHPVWVLSCPTFTWCHDVSTGSWFERKSYQSECWRGSMSVKFAGKWLAGDLNSGLLLELTEVAGKEDDAPLIAEIQSAPVRDFPNGFRVSGAAFDFTTGQGDPLGAGDEIDPQVEISWSKDGAATWSNPLLRSLGKVGEFRKRIRVDRLGRATTQGIRFRLRIPSGVYWTFRGGAMDALGKR